MTQCTHAKAVWTGGVSACQICKAPLSDVMIDGATKMGPWACMCEGCWHEYGTGLMDGNGNRKLGLGYGQLYRKQKCGHWVKEAG